MAVSAVSHWVDAVDRIIWPVQNSVDTNTLTHYFFSPYPRGLSADDILKWTQLQCEVLAPFPDSYHYVYKSKVGLHLWFSASPLNGIPETATQAPLGDGKHKVVSQNFSYTQQWEANRLLSCVGMPKSAIDNTTNAETLHIEHHGWATQRQLVSTVSTPWFWAKFSLIMLLGVLIFVGASALTTQVQLSSLNDKSEELSELVGPKLSQQSTLAGYISRVNQLRGVQTRSEFLPEALSLGFSVVPQNTQATIQSIEWQNNQLTLAIEAADLDITRMIEDAEANEDVKSANIRPGGNENTWLLELIF